jgi:hypothetical protein
MAPDTAGWHLSTAAPELKKVASNCQTNSQGQSQSYVTTDGQFVFVPSNHLVPKTRFLLL